MFHTGPVSALSLLTLTVGSLRGTQGWLGVGVIMLGSWTDPAAQGALGKQ